jgi:N-acetyl-anhydromuramoyl-L-alanine amidase
MLMVSSVAMRTFILQVDLDSGLMRGARQVASPNCDARPQGMAADLIVVHGISLPPGEFGGPWIERFFTNSLPLDRHPYFAEIGELRVSSHLLVARDGGLTQFVRFTDRAWHAGQSSYNDRIACNDFSIGVELEGVDTIPYEAAQYHALAEVVAALCDAYPRLSAGRVVGHSDISPGRKTDPGPAFDWQRAHRCIAAAGGRTLRS